MERSQRASFTHTVIEVESKELDCESQLTQDAHRVGISHGSTKPEARQQEINKKHYSMKPLLCMPDSVPQTSTLTYIETHKNEGPLEKHKVTITVFNPWSSRSAPDHPSENMLCHMHIFYMLLFFLNVIHAYILHDFAPFAAILNCYHF